MTTFTFNAVRFVTLFALWGLAYPSTAEQNMTSNDLAKFQYLQSIASTIQAHLSENRLDQRKGSAIIQLNNDPDTADFTTVWTNGDSSVAQIAADSVRDALVDLKKRHSLTHAGLILVKFTTAHIQASNKIDVMFSPFLGDHVLETVYYDVQGRPDLFLFRNALRRTIMRNMFDFPTTQKGELEFDIMKNGTITGTNILRSCGIPNSDDLMRQMLESRIKIRALPSPGPEKVHVRLRYSTWNSEIVDFSAVASSPPTDR